MATEAELASLLDQCSAEELASIVASLEEPKDSNDGSGERQPPSSSVAPSGACDASAGMCKSCNNTGVDFMGQPCSCSLGRTASSVEKSSIEASVPKSPSAPVAPPGSPSKRPIGAGGRQRTRPLSAGGSPAQPTFSLQQVQQLLEEHRASVVDEVRKLVSSTPSSGGYPSGPPGGQPEAPLGGQQLNAEVQRRDEELIQLEAKLAQLQDHMVLKDKRMAELSQDLEQTVREVRHRQLDLEFHQLKLEERMRMNQDLEQNQKKLTIQVDDASLTAKHAALDADLARSPMTPRSMRVQGSLPWAVRTNRSDMPLSARALNSS